MKKILSAILCSAIIACAIGLASCDDTKTKLDKESWEKAIDDTLSARNFTVKETMTMDDATVIVDAMGDYASGKFWAKYTQGEGDESQNGETYWVKGNLGTTAYSKEGDGGWEVGSEDEDFDELFDDWMVLGDGIKDTLLSVKGKYDTAEFEDGVYTITVPAEGDVPAISAKLVMSKGYIKTAELGSEGVTLKLEFKNIGSTKMPAVPTVGDGASDSGSDSGSGN